MPVSFDYYWNLRKEGRNDFEKYRARNLPERFKNFKADKILYEKQAKSVNYHPFAGRYDRYLNIFSTGKRYKPGKLLDEFPQYPSYVYFYKGNTPVFVRQKADHALDELEIRKSPKRFVYKPNFQLLKAGCFLTENGHVFFDFKDKVSIQSIYKVQEFDNYSRYFNSTFLSGNKTRYPDMLEEILVSKDRKEITEYSMNNGIYNCNHEILDGPCDDKKSRLLREWSDSEYVDTSSPMITGFSFGDISISLSLPGIDLNPMHNGYQPIDISEYLDK